MYSDHSTAIRDAIGTGIRGRKRRNIVNECARVGKPQRVEYNPDIPIGKFDLIVVDECHRSIYLEWMNVLDYFDARIVGLTATRGKRHSLFLKII